MSVQRVERAFEDARGSIADILEDEIIEHVTLIATSAGAVRGNHVHRETHQWVYIVSGALRYVTRDEQGDLERGVVRAGDRLYTGPMDAHAMEALEDTTMVVMTRGPRGGREYESDTFRLEDPLIADPVSAQAAAPVAKARA
jgi:oxalate decarboxylase/phosphoglucose isomerase-like protein (cupin superfamily)